MKPLLLSRLPFAKPTKQTRPGLVRKRLIKKRDKKLSKETETFRCEECGKLGPTDPAHIVPRRFQKLRHDPNNIKRKCRKCHHKERYKPSEQRATILRIYS